jgi:hypothetical protein
MATNRGDDVLGAGDQPLAGIIPARDMRKPSCLISCGHPGLKPVAEPILQAGHNSQALDLVIQIRLQEGVIVFERHAAIRISIRP